MANKNHGCLMFLVPILLQRDLNTKSYCLIVDSIPCSYPVLNHTTSNPSNILIIPLVISLISINNNPMKYWLVVSTLKNLKVSWGDDIPN